MKRPPHVKPISYLKRHDVRSSEQQKETFALIKILAIGNSDIEQQRFRDAKDVFAELDAGNAF